QTIMTEGQIEVPTEYEAPYIITRRLIEDGRNHLVLKKPLKLPFPARFLQGTMDEAVDQSVPLKILQHADCDDMQLTLVKGVDHRFSEPACLTMIGAALDQVIAAGSA
ncbi:MAG: alpha/beta hydrolase, partial [Marinosulfonomonas sp.]|nr:alpha/beta hydrolase [Marinosulfonomonas sp.]